MRQTLVLATLLLVSRSPSQELRDPIKIDAWIDALRSGTTRERARLVKKTKWSDAVVAKRLLEAASEAEESRAVAILQLLGELRIGADAAVAPLVDKVRTTVGARSGRGTSAAVKNRCGKDVGSTSALTLGELAPYVTQNREDIRILLGTELRDCWGWHIERMRRAYFRCLVDGNAPLPDLLEKLRDKNAYVRETAAEVLGNLGRGGVDAVPKLLDALVDEHPMTIRLVFGGWTGNGGTAWTKQVRNAAAVALVRIAPMDKRVLPAHFRVLQREKRE